MGCAAAAVLAVLVVALCLPGGDSWGSRTMLPSAPIHGGGGRRPPRLPALGVPRPRSAWRARWHARRGPILRGSADEAVPGDYADDGDDGDDGESAAEDDGEPAAEDEEVDAAQAQAFDRSSIQVLEEVTFVPSKMGVVAQWLQTLVSGSKEPLYTAPAPTGEPRLVRPATRVCAHAEGSAGRAPLVRARPDAGDCGAAFIRA